MSLYIIPPEFVLIKNFIESSVYMLRHPWIILIKCSSLQWSPFSWISNTFFGRDPNFISQEKFSYSKWFYTVCNFTLGVILDCVVLHSVSFFDTLCNFYSQTYPDFCIAGSVTQMRRGHINHSDFLHSLGKVFRETVLKSWRNFRGLIRLNWSNQRGRYPGFDQWEQPRRESQHWCEVSTIGTNLFEV